MRSVFDRLVLAAVVLWAVASVLPLGAWTGVAPLASYRAPLALWWWTLVIALLASALLLLLSGGAAAAASRALLGRASAGSPRRFLLVVGMMAAAEAAAASWLLFDRTPPLIDAWVQAFQARVFLAGRVVAPAPRSAAHFATLFTPIGERGWFSQYPPVHSLLLALGLAAHAMWLVTPLLAAALPAALYVLARPTGDERVARLAAFLPLLSPFVVAMDGSAMNHLPAALCVAFGLWAAAEATLSPLAAGAIAGGATGLAFGLRPLDALVLAGVVGAGLLVRIGAMGRGRGAAAARVALGAAVAGTITLLPTLVYNAVTTGHALRFTYTAVWGSLIGFDRTPWGERLTVIRAIGNTAVDAFQLNVHLLDWPLPVTGLIAAGLWMRRRLDPSLRVTAAYLLGVVTSLFFYFHRDVLFGPRLLFSAVPAVLVLLAAALVRLADVRRPLGWRGLAVGDLILVVLATTALLAAVTLAPRRLASFRTAGGATALHPDDDARRADVHHAVVLVPDGFGTRLIVRLWAAGIPMRDSTRYYDAFDACALDALLRAAETSGASPDALRARLDAALATADPGRTVPGITADPMLRLPSDGRLDGACADEIRRDREGTVPFAPYVYLDAPTLDGDVVWARELGAADAALARAYPDRPVYRYLGRTANGGAAFTRVMLDLGFRRDAASGAEVEREDAVAEEERHEGAAGEERAERDRELRVGALIDHDADPDQRADERGDHQRDEHAPPAEERADHRQELDVAAAHALLAANRLIAEGDCQQDTAARERAEHGVEGRHERRDQ